MANETLLTVKQYADLIGYSRQRVYQMIEQGELQAEKVSNVVFIDLAKNPVSKFIKK